MRRSSIWIGSVGVAVLVGGMVITNVVTAAGDTGKNPITQILAKLDQILTALNGSAGGNHTLRWDTNHPSATRFTTAFPGAVLDNNTGLVWEQAPDAGTSIWSEANRICVNKTVGGTKGWRLPSVVELVSVMDPSLPAPFVPGTVFTGVQITAYWSASSLADDPLVTGWFVSSQDGRASVTSKNQQLLSRWCVRGGMNADAY